MSQEISFSLQCSTNFTSFCCLVVLFIFPEGDHRREGMKEDFHQRPTLFSRKEDADTFAGSRNGNRHPSFASVAENKPTGTF